MVGTILICVAALALLAGVTLVVLAKLRPQSLAGLLQIVMRSGRARGVIERKAVQQIASDPDRIAELGNGMINNAQSRQLASMLKSFSPAEREEKLTQLLEQAQSGQRPRPEQLQRTRPRTGSEARAKSKRKQRNRARNRQARRQRRR